MNELIRNLTPAQYETPTTKKAVAAFVDHYPNSKYFDALRKLNSCLVDYIKSKYEGIKSESLYRYVHSLHTTPACPTCGNNVKFVAYGVGYQTFCCKKCANASDIPKQRRSKTNVAKYGNASVLASEYGKQLSKQTCVSKYGVDNVGKCNEVADKRKQTMNDRYGVNYTNESPELKAKYEQTMMERHGVTHPSQNPLIYNNRNEAMRQKYGAEHAMQCQQLKQKHAESLHRSYGVYIPLQSPVIQSKFRDTMVSRYGSEYTAQVDWLFEQMKQTNLERYGVEYPLQNEDIQRKYRETSIERYGVECPLQNEDIQRRCRETSIERYGVEYPVQNQEVKQRRRMRMEEAGKWIPKSLWDEARLYYSQVWKITNQQPLINLENFHLRGLAGIEGAYHVDHKVSIKHGFEHGIPPYIVGNISNLEMLPWRDNVYKSTKCSMPPDVLIETVLAQQCG